MIKIILFMFLVFDNAYSVEGELAEPAASGVISESEPEVELEKKIEGLKAEIKDEDEDEEAKLPKPENENKAVFLGHLLTPTTYLPPKKTISVGTHVLTYSFSDELMVGTSSFLLFFYNSPNIFAKYGKQYTKKQRWSVQFNYLKSDLSLDLFNTAYYMEAAMGWFSWSYDVTSFYTFHASVSYMHFFNEGKPHSLRREPFNDQPFQFSLTTLHDVKVSERYALASEFGILGLNYEIPNVHGAVSFRYTRKNYFIQFGVSFDAHVFTGGFDTREYISNNPTLDPSHTDEFVIHPEAAFHYFF